MKSLIPTLSHPAFLRFAAVTFTILFGVTLAAQQPASNSVEVQREAMRKTGVRNLIERLEDLNGTLLVGIDYAAKTNGGWPQPVA